MAESGLNPRAERWGVWPDVSFGLTQITVALAGEFGYGDGSGTPANCASVRAALFDRETALEVGAAYLYGCLITAGHDWLGALRVYNGGSWALTDEYAERYPGNLASYERALAWAHQTVGGG